MIKLQRCVLAFLVFGLCFGAGCLNTGLRRAAVEGEVLVDKEPLYEGAINFLPTDDNVGPSAGIHIKNGKYMLPIAEGPIVGKNKVEIRGFRKTGRQLPHAFDKDKFIDETEPALGPEFNDQTTLVRDISEGKNTLNFDLSAKKKKE